MASSKGKNMKKNFK